MCEGSEVRAAVGLSGRRAWDVPCRTGPRKSMRAACNRLWENFTVVRPCAHTFFH